MLYWNPVLPIEKKRLKSKHIFLQAILVCLVERIVKKKRQQGKNELLDKHWDHHWSSVREKTFQLGQLSARSSCDQFSWLFQFFLFHKSRGLQPPASTRRVSRPSLSTAAEVKPKPGRKDSKRYDCTEIK